LCVPLIPSSDYINLAGADGRLDAFLNFNVVAGIE